jgi:positive regulator of sigma E activity
MEEQGTVIAIEGQKAVVQVTESDGCHTCNCKGFCIMAGDGSVHILADNLLGAHEGDMVTVTLGEGRKIAGTAIVFLTPLIGLFVGLFIGMSRGGVTGGVVGAIVGVALGLAVLWILDRLLTAGTTFRPRVSSINRGKTDH